MRRGRRKGASKDKVFGCDLLEHLAASNQEIPLVLQCCSKFIEEFGIVDGIYRLSGVSSNTQKLRGEFDCDGAPDLNKDVYRQDIHCVSSLCKAYFRELPNPLLTYQLYDKFADAVAVQLEEERLMKIKEVLKDLPLPHYRTLEYLMRHLVKMATYASETNMHARNLAIVWAPNLLRSKDIEATGLNGTAAFMEVRVQSIVVEFILTHVKQLFLDQDQVPERRKSLPSPTALSNEEPQFFRAIPFSVPSTLSPGNGPPPMRPYHAIIEGTDKRKGSLKGRKWKSIFNLGGRLQDPRRKNKSTCKEHEKVSLRPAKSMDSLSSVPYNPEGTRKDSTFSTLTQPSPTLGGEAGGGARGGAGSGYAVTYRRGGGASVSVVSGGGVQGTYSRLDSGEHAADSLPPPRSPGMASSRAERRAGMHISGPFSVTVPLHITSGLALGVLQGGGLKEEGGGVCREEGGSHREEGGVSRKEVRLSVEEGGASTEKDQARREEGVAHKENDRPDTRESAEERGEEGRKRDENKEDGAEGLKTELANSLGAVGGEQRKTERLSVEETGPAADTGEECDYVVMKGPAPQEEQDSQLPLDFQDTFGFLDLMDCSAYSQVNEFSVEPPCYDEEEEDDDDDDNEEEESGLQGDSLLMSTPGRTAQTPQTQRPFTSDTHMHACKSHSLPYKSRPFMPAPSSSEDEEDEEEEEGSDEEDDMMFYSLPSCLLAPAVTESEADTHKMADAEAHPTAAHPAQPGQNTNASVQSEYELMHCVASDWPGPNHQPSEKGKQESTDKEDGLELKKRKMELGESPTDTACRESELPDALTNSYEVGDHKRESGIAGSEDKEETEDLCRPEQREAEPTKSKDGDCSIEESAPKPSERGHIDERTEFEEKEHTAEPYDPEQKEGLMENTGSEGIGDTHHLKALDIEGGHFDSVMAELPECQESTDPGPLPLPEPQELLTCDHLCQEAPLTSPGEQEDTWKEAGGKERKRGGKGKGKGKG
ncbi:hypothetical protein GJAV_G00093980 [Gymnothorax javanicus]|nr:hypothetical protein GJAV_G00093980 [Gymnothorax javanicus]